MVDNLCVPVCICKSWVNASVRYSKLFSGFDKCNPLTLPSMRGPHALPTGQVVLFEGKEHRVLNGDETKLALDGKERQKRNRKNNLTLTNPNLPRPGKPEAKVCNPQ